MNDAVIVSYGIGGWYPKGLSRLRASLERFAPDCDLMMPAEHPAGCPSHRDSPYAFKPFLMNQAREAGYRVVIWMDVSAWAVKPIDPILEIIANRGCFFIRDGWNNGQWTSDAALPILGVTREESFDIPHLWAAAVGLDLSEPACNDFLDGMLDYAAKGAFVGPWNNAHFRASKDSRVLGHRHDQTAASLLVHRLHLPAVPIARSPFRQFSDPIPDDVCVVARGM